MKEQTTEVLIVGGGLTGLSASVFLSWHGIRSIVVERHSGLSQHPKARAINPRTTEVFRSVGLQDEVMAARSPIADNTDLLHVVTLAGAERVRLPRPEPEAAGRLSPSGWALIDQNRLEPILLERCAQAGGELFYNTELVALDQDNEGVTAVVRDRATGDERRVRAQYVIAADGNNSTVRQWLGVEQHGPGTLTNLVSFFFHADLSAAIRGRKIIAAYVNNDQLRGTLMPLDNDERWVFNVSYYPERGEDPKDFTAQWCVDMVRRGVGIDDLSVRIETTDLLPWEIAARVASTFRRGRVMLAGDAAHVMPPTGAFGASTGIQDVHNLAWKLAMVVKGHATAELLDSYDTERRPIAELMMTQSMLRFEIREGRAFAEVADQILDELSMSFGYRYTAGAFVPDADDASIVEDPNHPTGRPGTRAAHVVLARAGQSLSTVDLFGRDFVLLAGSGGQGWLSAGHEAAERRGISLRGYLVGPDGDLQDPNGTFVGHYGIGDGGAVLVRPDGFVAWRSVQDDPAHPLADVVAKLLSPTSALVGHP